MSEDRLPGWDIGPIILASLLTGVAVAWVFLALTLLSYPRPFADLLDFEFVLGLGTVTVLGLAAGLIVVLPISMIFSAIGIRLALSRQWVAYRWTWSATGTVVGAVILLVPFLLSPVNHPYGLIALFGAACGMTAALLCHRFLKVGRAD